MGLLDWLRGGKNAPAPAEDPAPAQVAHEEPRAELLSRFEDEGEIGRGGMSSVRRVVDKNLLRRVAMKVLNPELAARDGRVVQAFLEEAQITAQLDHPNLIPIHEMGVDADGTHYFTMRLVGGHTLNDWIEEHRENLGSPESLQQGLSILLKVCDALSFAHSRSVLHCDLKPANIMVGEFGEVYLMDWGLAQIRGKGVLRLAREGKASGTPGYMSPEQARGAWSECDERTDVFSLGAVLYHLVTGRAPFAGETVQAALQHARENDFDPPQLASPHLVPPELSRIVEKGLKAAKEERYQSAAELKRDLEKFLRGGLHFPSRTFPAGTRILVEGETGDTAYQIVTGRCRVVKNIDGKPTEVNQLGPGAVFGEAGLVSARPRTASVEAVEDVTAMVVTRAVLQESLGQGSWLGAIVLALAERFRDVDEQLTRLREEKARGEYWRLTPP